MLSPALGLNLGPSLPTKLGHVRSESFRYRVRSVVPEALEVDDESEVPWHTKLFQNALQNASPTDRSAYEEWKAADAGLTTGAVLHVNHPRSVKELCA